MQSGTRANVDFESLAVRLVTRELQQIDRLPNEEYARKKVLPQAGSKKASQLVEITWRHSEDALAGRT